MRYVNSDLVAHEEFIGLYPIPYTEADTIVRKIQDIELRMNLTFSNTVLWQCCGQCYDSAAKWLGKMHGVVMHIKPLNKKSLFPHCYSYALTFGFSDAIKFIQVLNERFNTAH